MSDQPGDITQLLHKVRDGEPDAEQKLFERVYQDFKRLAAAQLQRERAQIFPTELVNACYCAMSRDSFQEYDWVNRKQFLAAAAKAMRRILLDLARYRRAQKRHGQLVAVEDATFIVQGGLSAEQLALINELVDQVRQKNQRHGQIIDYVFYLGYTENGAAEELGVSRETVVRDLKFIRAWLSGQLNQEK